MWSQYFDVAIHARSPGEAMLFGMGIAI